MKQEERLSREEAGIHRFLLLPSDLGTAAVVWRTGEGDRVIRIYLPASRRRLTETIRRDFPGAVPSEAGPLGRMGEALGRLLRGQPVTVSFAGFQFESLTPFRRSVLLEAGRIPRGRVRTYGSLAAAAGHPGAARAVGSAMAANPFPLAIPCHRVVRSDGSPGGFGGGLALKRILLEREGILWDGRGRVRPDFLL